MTHDPLCPVGVKPWENTYCCQKCSPGETPPWERACQCDLISKVRADERWATVESAVFVASQYGCDHGLLNALNAINGES